MKDRTGQVWLSGDIIFLVTGPSKPGTLKRLHPVVILDPGDTSYKAGNSDIWPEEVLNWTVWEKMLVRLS